MVELTLVLNIESALHAGNLLDESHLSDQRIPEWVSRRLRTGYWGRPSQIEYERDVLPTLTNDEPQLRRVLALVMRLRSTSVIRVAGLA